MRQAESFQAIARDAVAALERAAQALERAVEENDQLRALLSIDAERGAAVN